LHAAQWPEATPCAALIGALPGAEIPRAQRRAAKRALAEFSSAHERNEAIALAYLSGQHTMSAIAAHFGAHYTTVSWWVKAYEVDLACDNERPDPILFV
jgi:Helix-turn-helix domain